VTGNTSSSHVLELVERQPPADDGRPALLLVHGLGHGAWCWEHWQAAAAEAGYPAYAVSLRGHGTSAGRLRTALLSHYVDDVVATASALPGPVVLVGHSMGGRAALGAAGAPNVVAVCALAPWLDGSDPVQQLDGRTVLIAHGDRERYTDPRESYAYALRAKRRGVRICRFDVPGAGHFMISQAGDWHRIVRRFVYGVLGIEPLDPVIANALQQPAASGLRSTLTSTG
jgi:dienelactone hydrolase